MYIRIIWRLLKRQISDLVDLEKGSEVSVLSKFPSEHDCHLKKTDLLQPSHFSFEETSPESLSSSRSSSWSVDWVSGLSPFQYNICSLSYLPQHTGSNAFTFEKVLCKLWSFRNVQWYYSCSTEMIEIFHLTVLFSVKAFCIFLLRNSKHHTAFMSLDNLPDIPSSP